MRLYTLKNRNGLALRVSPLGGTAMRLTAPDRRGRLADVLLGFDRPDQPGRAYIGTLIGRVGNRIARGRFTLDGRTCRLACNTKPAGRPCTLHGGAEGFDRRLWHPRPFTAPDGPALELTYLSPDGEEGFPGNLFARVVYTLTDGNAWRIDYWAMTDAPTVVNLTQHAYFNLGACRRDILGHELQLFCDRYTPTGPGLIPTGEIAPVAGTPLDFSTPTAIGARIDAPFKPMVVAGGYDHNFVIRRGRGGAAALVRCARVREPESGRVMECWTTAPCVQLYTGNFLDGSLTGKRGIPYTRRFGLCLETQHAPDAPNQPAFQSIVLRPGELYRHTTEYRFSAE